MDVPRASESTDPFQRISEHPELIYAVGAILVVGLAIDLWIAAAPLRRGAAPPLVVTRNIRPKPWGLAEVGLILGAICSLLLMGSLVFGWLERSEILAGESLEQAQLFCGGFVMDGLGLVAILLLLRAVRVGLREAFGIQFGSPWKTVGWSAFFLLAALPPVWLCAAVSQTVLQWFGYPPEPQPAVQMFLESDSVATRGIIGFMALIAAPVFEETFFRGLAYPALKAKIGFTPAVLVTSLLFGAIHFNAVTFLPLTVLAIGLTLAYEATGNLLVPIVMHGLFNLMTIGIMIIVLG